MGMKNTCRAGATLFLALIASHAYADETPYEFVQNYDSFRQMDPAAQKLYVMGLVDGYLFPNGAVPDEFAASEGLRSCIRERHLTSDDILAMVTAYYKANVEVQSEPPIRALIGPMFHDVCFDFINSARVNRGLFPWAK